MVLEAKHVARKIKPGALNLVIWPSNNNRRGAPKGIWLAGNMKMCSWACSKNTCGGCEPACEMSREMPDNCQSANLVSASLQQFIPPNIGTCYTCYRLQPSISPPWLHERGDVPERDQYASRLPIQVCSAHSTLRAKAVLYGCGFSRKKIVNSSYWREKCNADL